MSDELQITNEAGQVLSPAKSITITTPSGAAFVITKERLGGIQIRCDESAVSVFPKNDRTVEIFPR